MLKVNTLDPRRRLHEGRPCAGIQGEFISIRDIRNSQNGGCEKINKIKYFINFIEQ